MTNNKGHVLPAPLPEPEFLNQRSSCRVIPQATMRSGKGSC